MSLLYGEAELASMNREEFLSIDAQQWATENYKQLSILLFSTYENCQRLAKTQLAFQEFESTVWIELRTLWNRNLSNLDHEIWNANPESRLEEMRKISVSFLQRNLLGIMRHDSVRQNTTVLFLNDLFESADGEDFYLPAGEDLGTNPSLNNVQFLSETPIDDDDGNIEIHAMIEEVLAEERPSTRDFLRLRIIEHMSYKNIADMTGLAPVSACDKLLDLRNKMADMVCERHPELADFANSLRKKSRGDHAEIHGELPTLVFNERVSKGDHLNINGWATECSYGERTF